MGSDMTGDLIKRRNLATEQRKDYVKRQRMSSEGRGLSDTSTSQGMTNIAINPLEVWRETQY